MPYLICDECDHYYEVEDKEDFTHCQCGRPLIKVNELSEFYGPEVLRESISTGNTYTEERAFDYYENQNKGKNLKIIGILLIISGLALIFFNLIFIIFTIIGVGLYLYSQSFISINELKGKGWAKGLEGEDIASHHLKELPHDYFIYNDVNLLGKKGNIDHGGYWSQWNICN
ncbi:hypothetical protein [Methanobacterium alcaliphilum]|uniref:hypothetical protein n=1 Tax=Methanobacterium alcaliphilum TaxID=392018 RepID=UPI00200B8CFC|nr:hypothetical protein [Methanobacterium alcaliphilum]MCK9151378.1 hypothetical protein [Methanobacterium alcaliphilum]